jgi:hypothetical protein
VRFRSKRGEKWSLSIPDVIFEGNPAKRFCHIHSERRIESKLRSPLADVAPEWPKSNAIVLPVAIDDRQSNTAVTRDKADFK